MSAELNRTGHPGDQFRSYSRAVEYPVFRAQRMLVRQYAACPEALVGKTIQPIAFCSHSLSLVDARRKKGYPQRVNSIRNGTAGKCARIGVRHSPGLPANPRPAKQVDTAMNDPLFSTAVDKGARAERLSPEEAFELAAAITPDRVHALGRAALTNRRKRFGDQATFVFNIQINPANICGAGCTFCNYAASRNDDHAYVLSEDEILSQVEALRPTEAHIVGGLNQVWPYERNLDLVRRLRENHPALHIKAFTAVEIAYFARTTRKNETTILRELKAAGMNALPGGGAEIFSDRLYKRHWKNKIGPQEWIRIHQLAHRLEIPTNATMLYGFGDTWRERVAHLLTLRQAQDESKGFACFIPLPFQPGEGKFETHGPTPMEILAVLAISRLVLDNVSHLKSYWPMTGLEAAAAGLSWGADDMDGTILEEKIAHLAGASTPKGLAREKMTETIHMAGFRPLERDGRFGAVS